MSQKYISVLGAAEHNLKNIDIDIPAKKLTVITGLSGSGKSSLAFDTIYAEGQRRYMETFSAYARQFIGGLEKPKVEKISGLSPVIAIEQKTTSKNPRSTVGTVTEIYDFLRVLFARAAEAYSYLSGLKMVKFSEEKIYQLILEKYNNKKIVLLAPKVRSRKGHYRDLFEQLLKKGYSKARIDGEIIDMDSGMQLDRYKNHDIEVVIDRIKVEEISRVRLKDSISLAFREGKNVILIYDYESKTINYFSKNLMCPETGLSYDDPAPNLFSFNSPYGSCPKCGGLGHKAEIDLEKIIPDSSLSINKGAISPLGKGKNNWAFTEIEKIGKRFKFNLNTPINEISEEGLDAILYGYNDIIKINEDSIGVIKTYIINFEGIINFISNQNEESNNQTIKNWSDSFMQKKICDSCNGTRLKKESLFFKIDNKHIAELAEMSIISLREYFKNIEERLTTSQNEIAKEVLKEIRKRMDLLIELGLGYLCLNRSAGSLSGGEAQRIRLATQIGSQLVNVLYILDEPSIGLHQRDNVRLINSLKQLRDISNSVIVVEHDKEMILSADYVIDIGPAAGIHGGEIVAKGTPEELLHQNSLTCKYLRNEIRIEVPKFRRDGSGNYIEIIGARGHNLKNINVKFPLGKLVCVTGVSGSGKTSLINDTLFPILSAKYTVSQKQPLEYDKIIGSEYLDKVIVIDQSPIGRTPRSNPATYTGVFTDIRNLFAAHPEAKIRGYKAGRFSFNVKGGRCEVCQGAGIKTIEMNFLPNVYVPCDNCHSKRYNRETLEVRYKGKSISDVLDMTIETAVEFFENIPSISRKIETLKDVGLGYISLGQPATTLSGGEAQRVKLATELSKKDTGKTLYILDEPTTGLHFEDIKILLNVLQNLVDKGNSMIIIEHNLDVIKVADYIIDMGPEGGDEGGIVVCEGTPEEVSKNKISRIAPYLIEELK